MFAKLLKHDWRSIRGLVGLQCAIILVSGLLLGGLMRYMVSAAVTDSDFLTIASAVLITAAILSLVFCSISSMYLLAHRFYKSRFSDQGYLMLTLPVTTHQHLLSGIVNTALGLFLVGITAFASTAAASVIAVSGSGMWTEAIRSFRSSGVLEAADWDGFGRILLLQALNVPVTFLAEIIFLLLAFTVSAQVRRHPVIAGAGLYFFIQILLSETVSLLSLQASYAPDPEPLVILLSTLVHGIAGVIAYFLMHYIMDKKLNLT